MKKLICLLLSVLLIFTLCSCSINIHVKDDPSPRFDGTFTAKIVDIRKNTLLAVNWSDGEETADNGIYLIPTPAAESMHRGDIVSVNYSGLIFESEPAELGGVKDVEAVGASPDRTGVCIAAFRELWKTDESLNSGITQIAVNITGLGLTPGEIRAAAYLCGSEFTGCFGLAASLSELLSDADTPEEWMLFEISGVEETETGITFTASKTALSGGEKSISGCRAEFTEGGFVFTPGTVEG